MIIAREFKDSDIKPIDEIFQKQPELGVPGLKNMIVNATIENTDTSKVVGYGAVKLFSEAILILDQSIPKRERAKAIREAMQTAILFSRDAGLEYLYAVSSDEGFSEVLRRSYGFRAVPGELLMMDLSLTSSEDV